MYKQINQRAWFLVAPVVILVAFNAVIPLLHGVTRFLTPRARRTAIASVRCSAADTAR